MNNEISQCAPSRLASTCDSRLSSTTNFLDRQIMYIYRKDKVDRRGNGKWSAVEAIVEVTEEAFGINDTIVKT
ncbi:hypothetical protein E2542_SST31168 [Spatholobus suberectus]|nr:hypothetical protein E2542_SST31168 [Spatholobus suberectus]